VVGLEVMGGSTGAALLLGIPMDVDCLSGKGGLKKNGYPEHLMPVRSQFRDFRKIAEEGGRSR